MPARAGIKTPNRLTSGVTTDSAYAERNITYDQAGNIQTLSRVYGGNLVDSLVYNYTKNAVVTDQVQTIQDLSADPGTTGFAAGTGTYHYDPNGNMNTFSSTNPAAKTYSTTYNLLNLPNLINSAIRSVYEYDASGESLAGSLTPMKPTTSAGYSMITTISALSKPKKAGCFLIARTPVIITSIS